MTPREDLTHIKVDESLVRGVAKLAKLKLTEQEVVLYQQEIPKIVDLLNQLAALDQYDIPAKGDDIDPLGKIERQKTQENDYGEQRDDSVVRSSTEQVEFLLACAVEKSGTSFVVPRIIES